MTSDYPFADLALARRLEAAEGDGCVGYVEARAQLDPAVGAATIEVAGAACAFDGPASPITQTFGLGVLGTPTDADLDTIEGFFANRGAPTAHEVAPHAPIDLMARLADRGYRPIEVSNVMYRPTSAPIPGAAPGGPTPTVRTVGLAEASEWGEICVRGWEATGEFATILRAMGPLAAARRRAAAYVADLDGVPIAAGAMSWHQGVMLLAGACTVPEARNRGAQRALLAHRLGAAASLGCDLAMMVVVPGSASQRNAERQGFRIAYTRTKWLKT
ncbi:MAG: GNAT family N-acetyltransferase [Gemmatimonadales bacterium]|nr:GNAT family N-acetyltransferase [Gemmatimonadales bacterium]